MRRGNKSHLVDLALAFYIGEPYRICGEKITKQDIDDSVWADCNQSQLAHGYC